MIGHSRINKAIKKLFQFLVRILYIKTPVSRRSLNLTTAASSTEPATALRLNLIQKAKLNVWLEAIIHFFRLFTALYFLDLFLFDQ